MNRPTWGAIFDWDGVIIDSGAAHKRSWELLAQEEDRRFPSDRFAEGFGMKNERIIPKILGWTTDPGEINRLSLRKEELYRTVVRTEGMTPLPGVATWLERLQTAGIPCVIGSSTHRLNITTTLDVLEWPAFFQAIVSAEDVTHGKPDPAIFLLAASKIPLPPSRCVVFEDAPVGVAAARAAAMKVVGVTTTHAASALGQADRVVPTLAELTVAELGEWF